MLITGLRRREVFQIDYFFLETQNLYNVINERSQRGVVVVEARGEREGPGRYNENDSWGSHSSPRGMMNQPHHHTIRFSHLIQSGVSAISDGTSISLKFL